MARSESVLIFSKNEALALKVLYCASAAGLDVDVVSLARSSATRFSRYCRNFFALSERGDSEASRATLAAWINRQAEQYQWVAVLADDVSSHGLLNALSNSLNVPAFAPSQTAVLDACHDKWSFYCHMKEANVRTPASHLVLDAASLSPEQADAIGFPLLVKPLNAESSHGIRRFDDFESLLAYLRTPGPYKRFPLLIQRFIAGHTLGLSLLAIDGTIRCHDVQLHADDGSRLFYGDAEVLEAGQRIVAAYSYGGPGHIDFVRDDATGLLYALEFNCRFWYSVTVSMWRRGNFPALAVELARGRSVPASPTLPGRYFQPGTVAGMLRRPQMLAKLDARNWQGFWQAISDPLPHLVHHLPRFS